MAKIGSKTSSAPVYTTETVRTSLKKSSKTARKVPNRRANNKIYKKMGNQIHRATKR